MKIVHVLPYFLPETVAGTEVYCWSICKYLQRQGIASEVVIPGYDQTQTTEYEFDGIRVVKYAEPTKPTRLHLMRLVLPEGLGAFKDYLQTARPDWVHFHGIYGGTGITIQHIAEAKALGFHIMYTMHLSGDVCRSQTLVYKDRELCDGVIRPARCAVCSLMQRGNNEWVANAMAGLSAGLQKVGIDAAYWNNSLGTGLSIVNRIVDMQKDLQRLGTLCDKVVLLAKWFQGMMIANGFPPEKMEYIPQALSYTGESNQTFSAVSFRYKDSLKLVFAGRIHPAKGIDTLLKAIQDLPEEKIELSIYGKSGDDEYYNYCRSLSDGKNNIYWRGLLPREQVLPAFRQHDMFCLPSAFSEMSPLVIQEAFAAGIPVLASGVYGNAELIRPGHNGLLFPFKSVAGLREQLDRVFTENSLLPYMKSQVSPPLSFDSVGKQYLDLYRSIA
jgi:glycosyltransferase involved in cell wall biosynthesis